MCRRERRPWEPRSLHRQRGIWPEAALPLHEQPSQRIREVLEINLLGAMWTARAFPTLARQAPARTAAARASASSVDGGRLGGGPRELRPPRRR